MKNSPFWLTEADVTSLIDLNGAIAALESTLKEEAGGMVESMPKTHLMVGANNAMHALGGALQGQSICGTKTWVNIDGKSATLLIIYSLEDGSCRAVIEATALGQLRTAAMTGVGTKWLAAKDIQEMAIIGTGKQALPQVAACAAVRPIKRVRIFSRVPENRAALAKKIFDELKGIEPVEVGSLEAAVLGVPLITLCTNATEPFLFSHHVMTGAHINAVGAIVPNRVEFGEDIFPRCGVVAVDTVTGVRSLSQEFMDYFGSSEEKWNDVRPISSIIAEGTMKNEYPDLTLFKAMGMGLSDLAVASQVLKSCSGKKVGHELPERYRMTLPLQAVE